MCDPIISFPEIEKAINESSDEEDDKFSKKTVEEYLKLRNSFTKYSLWHYSQLEVDFNKDAIKRLLEKLTIPIKGINVTVFGGFTGQFALCLRDIGMHVIFTDPRKDWVQEASKLNFESYRFSVARLSREIIEKTDLFATFECYPALPKSASKYYDMMRLLTTKYGILFAESKRTREQLDKESGGPSSRIKSSFISYKRTYGIKRISRESEKRELRLYHFCANESQRKLIKTDCRVMKHLYDIAPLDLDQFRLNEKNATLYAKVLGIEASEWRHSIRRILDLQPRISDPYKRALYHEIDPDAFRIYSKEFKVENDLLKTL